MSSRSLTSSQRWAPRRAFSTTSALSDFLMPFWLRLRPAATFSAIDIVGKGFGAWNTMPTSRRTVTGSIPAA